MSSPSPAQLDKFHALVPEVLATARAVRGFLTEKEMKFLALAAAFPTADGAILEIGSFLGKSTTILATAGQLAPGILAHYYAGTTLGARGTTTVVRVLLLSGLAATPAKPLTVIGRIGTWTIDGISTVFPIDARLTLAPTATGATGSCLWARSKRTISP